MFPFLLVAKGNQTLFHSVTFSTFIKKIFVQAKWIYDGKKKKKSTDLQWKKNKKKRSPASTYSLKYVLMNWDRTCQKSEFI